MDNTEFEIADPAPPGKRTDGNHDLSQQHKHDEGEMEYHRVTGQNLIMFLKEVSSCHNERGSGSRKYSREHQEIYNKII